MACNCRDEHGELRPSCIGTCDLSKRFYKITIFEKNAKVEINFADSPFMFPNNVELVGYDQELKDSIKYK